MDTMIAYSTTNNQPHYFQIANDSGAQASGQIPAAFGGGTSGRYFASVPAALAPGYYTFALYRTSNDSLRAQGDFWWNGTDIVSAAEFTYLTKMQVRFDDIDAGQVSLVDIISNLDQVEILAAIAELQATVEDTEDCVNEIKSSTNQPTTC